MHWTTRSARKIQLTPGPHRGAREEVGRGLLGRSMAGLTMRVPDSIASTSARFARTQNYFAHAGVTTPTSSISTSVSSCQPPT